MDGMLKEVKHNQSWLGFLHTAGTAGYGCTLHLGGIIMTYISFAGNVSHLCMVGRLRDQLRYTPAIPECGNPPDDHL